jgi:hypothetical protein
MIPHMKRLILALGTAAGLLAVSAPVAAQASANVTAVPKGSAATVSYQAASTSAQWSPYIGYNYWTGWFGNCTIEAGPVYDPETTNGKYAVIGGGSWNCGTQHTITITTQEQFHVGGSKSWETLSPGGHYFGPATGTYLNGTEVTVRYCGVGYWRTRVQIAAAGYQSYYFYTSSHYASAEGPGCPGYRSAVAPH